MGYSDYFRGKKVTLMGLGLLGRGVGDAEFMASLGADLIVTDLKNEEELRPSLERLKRFPNIVYTLGEHRLEDFQGRDLILKAAGVPLDSPYIAEAVRGGIPVEMDESLFIKLCPPVLFIGVTGTRGKTTTTSLIYEILKEEARGTDQTVHLAGNIKGLATLPLLPNVKRGDTVVAELSSWQLQGFSSLSMSPHIAVFTNFMPDHLNYYKGDLNLYFEDKATIFKFQSNNDYLIAGEDVEPLIKKKYGDALKSELIVPPVTSVPSEWRLLLKGRHNRENIAQAIAVARVLSVSPETVKKVVENFKGVEGRMQFVRTYKGRSIYNDTTATTPDATLAALRALGDVKKVVLIMGGSNKKLDMAPLMSNLSLYCKAIIVLPGTGTDTISAELQTQRLKTIFVKDLKSALSEAIDQSDAGDVVLFSPAFASFGQFQNEFDRGDQFLKLVQVLK